MANTLTLPLLTPRRKPTHSFGLVPRQPWAAASAAFTCFFLMQVPQIPAAHQYPHSTFQPALSGLRSVCV